MVNPLLKNIRVPQKPSLIIDPKTGRIEGITSPDAQQSVRVTPTPSRGGPSRSPAPSPTPSTPSVTPTTVTLPQELIKPPTQQELLSRQVTTSIAPQPIYRGGKLIGIDDPTTKQSRLPTPAERMIYGVSGTERLLRAKQTVPFPEPPSRVGTQITPSPRIGEFEEQIQRDIRGEAIAAVPAQYFGTIFDKPLTSELAERAARGGPIRRAATFLDPRFQYDVAEYSETLKSDAKSVVDLNQRLQDRLKEMNEAQTKYDAKEISAEELNRKIESYNAFAQRYNQDPSVKRLTERRSDAITAIARSDLPASEKIKLAGAIRIVQNVPLWFSPVARAVVGTEMVRTGLQSFDVAETPGEKLLAGVQIGGGALLGLGSFLPSKGLKITGTPGQARVFKGATYASGITLGGSIGAVDYFGTLSRTGDPSTALGTGLGTGLSIVGPLVAKDIGKAFSPKQIKKMFGDKRGTAQILESTYADEVVEVIYNGKKVRMTLSDARKLGLSPIRSYGVVAPISEISVNDPALKFLPKDKKIQFLKEALRSEYSTNIYLSDIELRESLRKTKDVLKSAGLSEAEQVQLIKDVIGMESKQLLVSESKGAVLETPKVNEVKLVPPKDIQVTQPQESVFAGKGLYERTDTVPLFRTRTKTDLMSDTMSLPLMGEISLSDQRFDTLTDTQQKTLTRTKQELDSALDFGTITLSRLDTRSQQQQLSRLDSMTRLDSKTEQRLDSRLKQRLDLRMGLKTTQEQIILPKLLTTLSRPITDKAKPRDPLKPRKIIFGSLPTRPRKKVTKKREFEQDDKFFAFTKRYGQKKLIAVERTPEKAIAVGKRRVLGTLGATLKVKTAKGKPVKVTPDRFFRAAKTDPFAVVQRQVTPLGGRLTTPGERREIKLARQSKKSKMGGNK